MTKNTIIPKCMGKWRRHRWSNGQCTRTNGPRHCPAVRNPKAKEIVHHG